MEINETTMTLTRLCQFLGFAPYKILRNKVNQIVDFKLNRAMCIYGMIIMIIFSVLSNYALFYELYSDHSLRMNSLTSRIVFWLDINTVSASSLINIIVAMISLENTRRVNYLLNKIDTDLSMFDSKNVLHTKKAKRRITISVAFGFFVLTILLAADFSAWFRIGRKLRWNEKIHGQPVHDFDSNVYYLIPFYFMYLAFVPLHAKFAVTIYRIGQRYRSLNSIISIYAAALNKHGYFRSDYKQAENVVHRFMRIYDSLGTALNCESNEFGVTIIILMVSCLFHLVVTLYHIFVELLGEQDFYFLIMQVGWVIFHGARVILIIEPCHMVSVEGKKTVKCVCELMQTKHDLFILKHFWKKLLADRVIFSACGICHIDRQMLTSIGAAITTYLVILLQFQK